MAYAVSNNKEKKWWVEINESDRADIVVVRRGPSSHDNTGAVDRAGAAHPG